MPSPSTTTAVRTAYWLVSALLLLALAFCLLAIVSIGVGIARDGDSLLYGDPLKVSMQVSTEDLGPIPAGIDVDALVDVDVEVTNPTVKQMLLQSAIDIGPV